MAQVFKAKTLVSNTGIFSYEVSAPNLVYNTGDQTISGVKTFLDNINVSGSGIFNALDLNNIDILSLSGVDVTITNANVALTNRPTVNGTGVLLIGEATNNISNTINSSSSNAKLFRTNKLQYEFQDIKISGLKSGDIVSVFSDKFVKKSANNPSLTKIVQYLMIPSGNTNINANTRNTIFITTGVYSGNALRKFKNGPTIKNGYKIITEVQSLSHIKPRERCLDTIYDIYIPSGGLYPIKTLNLQYPRFTTSNNSIVTLKLHFKADNLTPCQVNISGGNSSLNPSFNTYFSVKAADYDFIQIERLMYHYRSDFNGGPSYVRI
jgi:hypothetical protein